jgi:hypothetical protein
VLDQGQSGPDLPRTQHDRQFLEGPRAHQVKDGPGSCQRALGEEPNPLEVHAEGALSDLLLMEQEAEVLAQLRVAELVRRASIVLSQLVHGCEIALVGLGGQAPEL